MKDGTRQERLDPAEACAGNFTRKEVLKNGWLPSRY
jgi:hypothetical protein